MGQNFEMAPDDELLLEELLEDELLELELLEELRPELELLEELLLELELLEDELLLELELLGAGSAPQAKSAAADTSTPMSFIARLTSDSDRILSIVVIL